MKRMQSGPSLQKLDGQGTAAFWARWFYERQEWARSSHTLTGLMPAAITPRAVSFSSPGRVADPLSRSSSRARRGGGRR